MAQHRPNVRTPLTPEADWQRVVIDLAHTYGWVVAHFKTAQRGDRWLTPVGADGKGFPDLVLARERIIYAELKGPKGQLRPEQKDWLELLRLAGQEVYVWKPKDLDVIQTVLAQRRVMRVVFTP